MRWGGVVYFNNHCHAGFSLEILKTVFCVSCDFYSPFWALLLQQITFSSWRGRSYLKTWCQVLY